MASIHTSDGGRHEVPEHLIIDGSIADASTFEEGTAETSSPTPEGQTKEGLRKAALGCCAVGCALGAVETGLAIIAGGAFFAGSTLAESHPKIAATAQGIGIVATGAAVVIGIGGGLFMAVGAREIVRGVEALPVSD